MDTTGTPASRETAAFSKVPQAGKLKEMETELGKEGKVAHFIIVNSESALAYQKSLVDVSSARLFQDSVEVGAWGQHGGGKDDMVVYGSDGKVFKFLPVSGSPSINGSSWVTVKPNA